MIENQYVNRELSWLQFNARVLQEAADPSVPLIERLRFIGIFSNNLDEFFKVRYATVKRIDMAGKGGKSILGGIKAADLLEEITRIVIKQQAESLKILDEIREELEDYDQRTRGKRFPTRIYQHLFPSKGESGTGHYCTERPGRNPSSQRQPGLSGCKDGYEKE